MKSQNSRFELKLFNNLPKNHLDTILVFQFSDGSTAYEFNLERYGLNERPHSFFLKDKFIKMLHEDKSPAKVLEIGSRDRSGFISKDHFIPSWMEYTGTDVLDGENVDVVCDVHSIGEHFSPNSFDYVFSLNVFEHVLVPWKAILELNKILKTGGKVMIFTHQTMPLHDMPTDYWRFSDKAWQALFNHYTGFKITYSGMGDPVSIVAKKVHTGSYNLPLAPAYIHSMVVAEKVGDSKVEWNIDITDFDDSYPLNYG
jgi:SAM-dependent methyltransferase